GCDEFIGSEHAGDRGQPGPIRRDVGPGRHGDVRLRRELGSDHSGDKATHPGAADHQPGRGGRSGRPGRRDGDQRGRAVNAVRAARHAPEHATEPHFARLVDVVDIRTFGTLGTPEWTSGWVFLRVVHDRVPTRAFVLVRFARWPPAKLSHSPGVVWHVD